MREAGLNGRRTSALLCKAHAQRPQGAFAVIVFPRSVDRLNDARKQPFASRTNSVLLSLAVVVAAASHIAANVDRQWTRKWENYTKDENEAELIRCGIEEAANGQCLSERDTAVPLVGQATLECFFPFWLFLEFNITVCGIII